MRRAFRDSPSNLGERIAHKLDPLDGAMCDFDWEGLARRMREESPDVPDIAHELARPLRVIFEWALIPAADHRQRDKIRLVGRRVIALAWAMNPALFEGSPSLIKLARTLRVERRALSRLSRIAAQTFGIANRAQMRHNPRNRTVRQCRTAAQRARSIIE